MEDEEEEVEEDREGEEEEGHLEKEGDDDIGGERAKNPVGRFCLVPEASSNDCDIGECHNGDQKNENKESEKKYIIKIFRI